MSDDLPATLPSPLLPPMTLYTTPDRTRFFLVPDDTDLPAGDLRIRTFVGNQRPGQERSVDEATLVSFEVGEDEARAWVKEELSVVLGAARERVMGFAERLKQRTAVLRDENRRTWGGVSEDSELQDAANRVRDGLKDVGRALQRLAKEGQERARAEPADPRDPGDRNPGSARDRVHHPGRESTHEEGP